jgi:hypothetical protein
MSSQVSDFYQAGVTTADVVGGPARVLVADPSVTTYPHQISDILNFATYAPQSGWTDIGHTNEPFTSTDGFETTDWISQQIGRINIQVGTWNRTISVSPMQKSEIVMDLVHQAVADRYTNDDGDKITYFWDEPEVSEWRMVAIHLNPNTLLLTADIFPRVKRNGSDAEMAWDRENAQAHATEFTPLPDDDVPNNANWYRIEQLG